MTSSKITKAELVEIQEFSSGKSLSQAGEKKVTVQFNPQSLKLNLSNQNSGGDQPGGASRQFVGSGTSKLTVELVFDTSDDGSDVRSLTEQVAYFVMAKEQHDQENRRTPPKVRFQWGSFIFEGVVDSMDETLEYFSEEGVPLRATCRLGMSRDDIVFLFGNARSGGAGKNTGATSPLDAARPGDSIASMAARIGASADWKAIASANDIDDPLRLEAGARINLNVEGVGQVRMMRTADSEEGADRKPETRIESVGAVSRHSRGRRESRTHQSRLPPPRRRA